MADTKQLIETLSKDASVVHSRRPGTHVLRLLTALALYMVLVQVWVLNVRPDIVVQLQRPLFAIELLLLIAIIASAAIAAAYAMYPDMYQKRRLLVIPYSAVLALLCLMLGQLALPYDARMMMPTPESHTIECTIYIGIASMLPACAMFMYLKKGATIMPRHAGMLIVIAATAIGAFTLRLCEPIDPASHHLLWHYVPNLLFALLGACLGRVVLRW